MASQPLPAKPKDAGWFLSHKEIPSWWTTGAVPKTPPLHRPTDNTASAKCPRLTENEPEKTSTTLHCRPTSPSRSPHPCPDEDLTDIDRILAMLPTPEEPDSENANAETQPEHQNNMVITPAMTGSDDQEAREDETKQYTTFCEWAGLTRRAS